MPAGKLNLEIEQGATYHKTLIWKDGNKVPIDLTGYRATMRVMWSNGGFIDLTTENGRITLGSGGTINLQISAEDTQATSDVGVGSYDLKMIIGEEEARLVEGHVYVSPGVTPRGL